MSTTRILPSAQSLHFGPSPATGSAITGAGAIKQFHRVQSYTLDWSREQTDIYQMGRLSSIDRKSLTLPTVNFGFTYNSTNVYNESGLGFYVGGDQSAFSYLISEAEKDKNFFVKIAPNNVDAESYAGASAGVIGIGNGSLNSYQAEGSVGGIPTCTVGVTALDMNFTTVSANIDTPAINPADGQAITGYSITIPAAVSGLAGQLTVLEPGGISVDINGAGVGLSNICVQSYSLGVDLNRTAQNCLGSRYPTEYPIDFPLNTTLTVDAFLKDLGTGRLSNSNCNAAKYNVSVTLRALNCDGSVGATKVKYTLQGASLDSQNYGTDIESDQLTTSLTFTSPIGSSGDNRSNFYISGSIV